MDIAIENYQCYYRHQDNDEKQYKYEVEWDELISNPQELAEAIKLLRTTYRNNAKPIAIAVFTEPKTLEELAKELE